MTMQKLRTLLVLLAKQGGRGGGREGRGGGCGKREDRRE